MKQIFLFLTVFFTSVQVYGQYIRDEQRQKELNNYLESIRKGREYGNTKTSEFKMNEQAVQEMVDRWKGAKQKREKSAEELRRAYELKEQAKASRVVKSINETLARRHAIAEMCMPLAMTYLDAGFQEFEAKALPQRSVIGVSASDSFYYKPDSNMVTTINAYLKYKEQKNSESFDELFPLILGFRLAGYTALKALEDLEKRFPEKKDIITYTKPFAALAYWTGGETMPRAFTSTSPRAYDYIYADKMDSLLKSWFRNDSMSVKNAIAQTKITEDWWNQSGVYSKTIEKVLTIARSPEIVKPAPPSTSGKTKVKKVKYRDNPYEGEVNEKNIPHGKGKLISGVDRINKKVLISFSEGTYFNGVKNGKFYEQYYHSDTVAYTYEGNYVMNFKEGWGKNFNPYNGTYEGEYWQDMRHGKGKMTYLDGFVEEGFWFYDTFSGRRSKEEE